MILGSFSSLIQLLGAFFFGFIGLKFLNNFYSKFIKRINIEEESIIDQVKTFSSIEIADVNELLNQFDNLKNKIRLLYDQRFVELFVKGGIYSLLILFYIGIENKSRTIGSSFILTSIYFSANIIYRVRFIFLKKPLLDIENIAAPEELGKNYFDIERLKFKQIIDFLFNGFKVHINFKRDIKIRMMFFVILSILLFHIPIIFHNYFIFVESHFETEALNFVSIILILASLMFPYVLLFITDSFTFYKVSLIRKNITNIISRHNEVEVLQIIES